jgi:flagellar protein FliS
MTGNHTQLAYQEAAVRNANAIELVVMLYDILVRDLQAAAEAIEAGSVELRTAKLKHGFLALQQLEGTLNLDSGSEYDINMSRFYSMLRAKMMTAQVRQDAAILRELIQLLFSVREAWSELNGQQTPSPAPQYPTARAEHQGVSSSWKA